MAKSVLAFMLTTNEDKLFRVLFPAEHVISQTTLGDLRQYPKMPQGISNRLMVIEAIKHSDKIAVDPTTFQRVKDERDKGTSDSFNWPSPEYRKTVPVGEKARAKVEILANRYFNGKLTDAIVWCLKNLNAMLYEDPHLIHSEKVRVRTSVSTRSITTRVPEAVYTMLQKKAKEQKITVSKMLSILAIKEAGDISTVEPEDFDFDLDKEDEDEPEH